MKLTADVLANLRDRAERAAAFAYAPYSKIQVGAAIWASDNKIYTGCNVENASYGLTVCAERNAVAAALMAITSERAVLIKAIYIASNLPAGIAPCGACRQVLAEFGKDGYIYFKAANTIQKMRISALLPKAFTL